jgi:hypothetical protein
MSSKTIEKNFVASDPSTVLAFWMAEFRADSNVGKLTFSARH